MQLNEEAVYFHVEIFFGLTIRLLVSHMGLQHLNVCLIPRDQLGFRVTHTHAHTQGFGTANIDETEIELILHVQAGLQRTFVHVCLRVFVSPGQKYLFPRPALCPFFLLSVFPVRLSPIHWLA